MSTVVQIVVSAIAATVIVLPSLYLMLKKTAQKVIDDAIDHSFAKKLARFNSNLNRSERAHEMLVQKEFDYYKKVGCIISPMITDVQDLQAAVQKDSGEGLRSFTKECSLRLLKSTMELKGASFEYQSFIPNEVFRASGEVVQTLQSNQQFWYEQITRISAKTSISTQQEIEEAIAKADATLMSIASLQTTIAMRLNSLCSTG